MVIRDRLHPGRTSVQAATRLITTGEFVVAGILPRVAADLAVTVGTAGLLITPYAVGMIIGGPVLNALTAASDRKRLMQALLVVAVVGNGVSALAPDFSLCWPHGC